MKNLACAPQSSTLPSARAEPLCRLEQLSLRIERFPRLTYWTWGCVAAKGEHVSEDVTASTEDQNTDNCCSTCRPSPPPVHVRNAVVSIAAQVQASILLFSKKKLGGEYWASLEVGKFAWFNPLRRGHLQSTLR